MKHEIVLFSPSHGQATITLVSWGDAAVGSWVHFSRGGFSRQDALEEGGKLMAWLDSMVTDSADEMPGDWVVISSSLDD